VIPRGLHQRLGTMADEVDQVLAQFLRGQLIVMAILAVYYAVTAILDPGIAPNHGSYLPIEVVAPHGTVLNPRSPAPVVGRNVFTHRVATVVMAALGQALPDRAVAPYYGNSNVYVLSTYDEEGQANVQFEIEVGGWGGRPGLDGPDCLSAGVHNLANNPIELVENEFPLRVVRYALRNDSGGVGRQRGGLGTDFRRARRLRTLDAVRPRQVSTLRPRRWRCRGDREDPRRA